MGKINTDNYPNRPFASYQDDDMFILQDNGGETYTTNVGDIKNLADSRIKLEGVQVNGTDLPISGKKVNVDISGKTDLSVIAYTFNSEMGYFKGAYVTYNGKLYEFIQEHTGAWNPSHVREIRASGQYVRSGNGGYNNGDRATCEGYMTKASGNYSHAEGRETQAVGECTHAEGRETIANSIYQHVEGKYNIADNESKYVHIIGNGINDNNRSNAMTLDWDGNLEVSGEVEDGNGEKISDKTDKVTNATSGHIAGLDSNGNLTDSGVSPTEDVTVEGNPVTFDSPFEQDAKSVVVSVKPIQDLHGYDYPWVGGAGKNKLPLVLADIKANNTEGTWSGNTYTYRNVTWTIQTDDGGNVTEINANGTANASSFLYLYYPSTGEQLSQNMVLNGCPAGGDDYTKYVLVAWQDGGNMEIDEGEGVTVSSGFTLNRVYAVVRQGFNAQNLTFHPMIRLATESDATFAPYSNECPISGIDEVEIEVTGKNRCSINTSLFPYERSGLTITLNNEGHLILNGQVTEAFIIDNVLHASLKKGQPYILQKNNIGGSGSGFILTGQTPNNNAYFSGNIGTDLIGGTNRDFANFNLYFPTVGDSFTNYVCDFQIEEGSTATPYEPYNTNSHTTTIPLPSTLYDADVDVTNGDADSRFGFAVFDGSNDEPWEIEGAPTFASGSKRFLYVGAISAPQTVATEIPNMISNGLQVTSGEDSWNSVDNAVSVSVSGLNLSIRVAGIDTVEGLKTWLSNNPVQVCYELATPTTISFDPTDVELLEGTNVVSTNAEKVAVTYGRSLWQDIDELKTDTEGKLDKSDVADVEGDTASKAYAVNDFMLRADGFYKVTAPIASGASITSSNTTKTTIGAVLTALLNA